MVEQFKNMRSFFLLPILLSTQLLLGQNNLPSIDDKEITLNSINLSGMVTDEDGNPLAGIMIYASSSFSDNSTTTNNDGFYSIDLNNQNHMVYAGAWGYLTKVQEYSSLNQELNFSLSKGYSDSFILDQGWEIINNAETGNWVREKPLLTEFNNWPCNPGSDSAADAFGEIAFITGNGGGGAGFDDVDNGETILRSPPMDLSSMVNPRIAFDLWFFNDGGQGTPNDAVEISLIDGTTNTLIKSYNNSFPVWFPQEINPQAYLSDLSNVIIEFNASDIDGSGHLVEAGIDNFFVFEGTSSTMELPLAEFTISPNPFDNNIKISSSDASRFSYRITDLTGKIILHESDFNTSKYIETSELNPGVYLIQVYSLEFQPSSQKIIKF